MIAGIVGSNTDSSYNRILLQFIARHFADSFELELCETADLPMFDASNDQTGSPPVAELISKVSAAEGVIISTPEYNYSIPSCLKSALEWISFKMHPLHGKPVMIVGAARNDQGSSRAQLHLRQILDAPGVGAAVLPGSEFLLSNVHEAFDEHGNIKDPKTVAFLESCVRRFTRFIKVAQLLDLDD